MTSRASRFDKPVTSGGTKSLVDMQARGFFGTAVVADAADVDGLFGGDEMFEPSFGAVGDGNAMDDGTEAIDGDVGDTRAPESVELVGEGGACMSCPARGVEKSKSKSW